MVLYVVWRSFNPSDDHYVSFFKRLSGMDLPVGSKILVKDYETHSVTEFGMCFIAQIPESKLNTFITVSSEVEENVLRSCGESREYSFNRVGKNVTDYPFEKWYLSRSGLIWAYYERY